MQTSVESQNMSKPSMLPLPNTVQYLPVFTYSPENFLIKGGENLLFSTEIAVYLGNGIRYRFMVAICNVNRKS